MGPIVYRHKFRDGLSLSLNGRVLNNFFPFVTCQQHMSILFVRLMNMMGCSRDWNGNSRKEKSECGRKNININTSIIPVLAMVGCVCVCVRVSYAM